MPSRSNDRYAHQNPNYDFLSDLEADRSPLEAPVQEFLAQSIQRAYGSGDPLPGDLPIRLSPELRSQFPGSVPTTIADAEQALVKSFYPEMLTIANKRENANLGMGDLFSEMTVGFRGAVQGWDPGKGGLFQYMTNSLNSMVSSALKGYTSMGVSMDTGETDLSFAAGPDPDRNLFNGVMPYTMPEPQPWYQKVAAGLQDRTVPSPFYAPAGQGMFIQDASGRTVINPNLTRSQVRGYEQVNVTGDGAAGYANTLQQYYATPKEDRVVDFGTGPQVKGINGWLRNLGGQLSGAEFVSTDAAVLGAVNGAENAFLRTHKATQSVIDATVQARNTTDAAFLDNVRSGTVGSNMLSTGVTVDGDPAEPNYPDFTIGEATRNTLDTFTSPTEQLMKSAASEVTVMGRLGRGKVQRWKIEHPSAATGQTLAWKNAKGAVEKYQNSEEALLDSIENDPSIPDEYKSQAFESVMASRRASYGNYGSLEQAAVPEPEAPPVPGSRKPVKQAVTVAQRTVLDQPASATTVKRWAEDFRPVSGGSGLPAAGGGQGGGSDEPPEMPTNLPDAPDEEPNGEVDYPVSDVRNFPASKRAVAGPMEEITLASQAKQAAAYLTGNKDFWEGYANWIGKGKDAEGPFREWLSDVVGPDAPAAWDTIMAQKQEQAAVGGNSAFSNMIQSNPAWRTAHAAAQQARKNNAGATQPAPPPAGASVSSNGSRGGSGGATTSTPGITPEEEANRAANIASQREIWESRRPMLAANSAQNWRLLRRDTLERGINLDALPRGNPDVLTGKPEDFPYQDETNSLNEEIAHATNFGEIPESVQQRLQRVSLARGLMSGIKPVKALNKRSHELYGDYDEVGNQFVGRGGDVSITREQIGTAEGVYQNAVDNAFKAGGLEGLSHKEIAATIHKRVGDAIKTSLDQFEKDMKNEGIDAGTAKSVREKVQTVTGMMTQEGDDALSAALGAGGFKDIVYAAQRLSRKDFQALYENNTAFKQRVDEMGGLDKVLKGSSRVIAAGENAYEIGDAESGGGSDWGDRIKSIYQSRFGHMMMAQFMGQMAWKATGGSVMQESDQWAKMQSKYVGMDAFGGGQLGAGVASASHQQIASNFYGGLAYQQYGNLQDLSFALSQSQWGEGIGRVGNDLKMAAGAGAVAGIGTWGLGALVGSSALTAAAAPVAAGAAALVGIPSLAMSGYNLFTGNDSYSGMSWRNNVAGTALGYAAMLEGSPYLKGPGLTGQTQEEWTEDRYGMDPREWLLSTKLGKKLGPAFANWAFEGQTPEARLNRDIVTGTMVETGIGEDDALKQLSGLQKALGGFVNNEGNQALAKAVIGRATKQGTTAEQLVSQISSLAEMQGIDVGTDAFGEQLNSFSQMSFVGQQKYMRKASRDYQRYAQWTPYLEGGNAEGYALYQQLGGDLSMGQTQAVQSVLSQAQQLGVNLTPAMATSFAVSTNSLQPYQALEATRMSASLTQMGVGPFTGNFTDITSALKTPNFGFVSDVGNGVISNTNGNAADTMALIQGVTSGNQYALSDYGRMAGIGALQSVDTNGLEMGLKDMSGFLLYTQQNVLKQQNLTGAQTLSGLGMTFGATDQNALLTGGLWGYQQSYVNQTNAIQAQQLNMQSDQLASNRQYTYTGWGLENQMNSMQWEQQQRGFFWQNTMLDTNNRFRQEDADLTRQQRGLSNDNIRWTQSFDYQTTLMRRDWAREDYQYNTQMRQMSFGWNMEDMDEQIRRSSGYERAQLIKQRDRATLSNNLQSGQEEKQFDRQEKLWAREDERYQKGLDYNQKMIDLDNSRFELNQKQADEMYTLQKTRLNEEKDAAEQLHDVRMEMEKLQRERAEEQMDFQDQSLTLQKQQMLLQNEYTDNMTKLSHVQAEQEALLKKITGYSPAFSRMLTDFLSFLENASQVSTPTANGGRTSR
jgi:hypothetical protein